MKVKVGIVDDEQFGREFVAQLLQDEFPEVIIAFKAASVKEAHEKLLREQPDVLFLDIELGDGTAFDLLDSLAAVEAEVIFITAYDNFAIPAIKKGAVDYILKPIDVAEFKSAVNKVLSRTSKAGIISGFIDISSSQGSKRLRHDDIIRLEADSNYTVFFMADHSKIVASRTLSHFESLLQGSHFFRVHHKHLINLKHYRGFSKTGNFMAKMSDGSEVDVSVRRRNEFLKVLHSR